MTNTIIAVAVMATLLAMAVLGGGGYM